jgi:hypothetical protein
MRLLPEAAGERKMAEIEQAMARERQRELALEHLLFKTMEYVEGLRPGLLDFITQSLGHLGDSAHDETKDDEAVREVARRMIEGARRGG